MRVLIVNNDFRVYWKGRLLYLHHYLASQNIDLQAIELFGKGSPYDFDVYHQNEQWWTCLFPNQSSGELPPKVIGHTLFDALDKLNPDIVIGPSIVFFAGALGLRWAKKNSRKFIMFDDGKTSQIKRNFAVQWVKDLLIAQIDALWLPSKDYDTEYNNLELKNTPFFYGFNCIDNDLFKFKKQKHLDTKNIICVARLVPIKNLDGLLKAWKIVESKNTGYQLQIVGDGPERDSLNNLMNELELKTLSFLGIIANGDLPGCFYQAEAMVLASFSESWGLVVNEAMAAGLPVLLSNKVNAAVSLLNEGQNGFSFDPLNIEGIAEGLLKFINLSVEAKEEMSATSLAIINGMSFEIMGIQLINTLNQLSVKPGKKPGPVARAIMSRWNGRYNTATWDKVSS